MACTGPHRRRSGTRRSDDTEANFNVGLLITLHQNLGLDLGANSANEEWTDVEISVEG
jgi:hypothetical protein